MKPDKSSLRELAGRVVAAENQIVDSAKRRTAVVLSGGGSRGAYEAGVMLYLREGLSKRLGRDLSIDILAGTSVGAINAAFLGATMDNPGAQARGLCDAWRSLRVEDMITLRGADVVRAVRQFLGGDERPATPGGYRFGGILQTAGLERFVLRIIPWRGIHHNLKSGHYQALALTATQVATGHSTIFIDSASPVPTNWSHDPFVRHRATRIGPRHVLASAALPLFFPTVKIGNEFYTDGGLRQNTPMSPAIRLGANRLLLISLRHVAGAVDETRRAADHSYPRPLFLFGKMLDALLLDHTGYDLARMDRLNAILEAGERAFGKEFRRIIDAEFGRLRGAPLRSLEAVHICPSVDIGALASDFVNSGRARVRSRIARRLISRLARGESQRENDLLSYLLFDGNYAAELIDLGYEDARRHEEELAKLFRLEVS